MSGSNKKRLSLSTTSSETFDGAKPKKKEAFGFAKNQSAPNTKFARKFDEEGRSKTLEEIINHSKQKKEISFKDEEPWIAGFIDLIYVATIMNISHFLTNCGAHFNVWLMAAAYFTIMFMTRMNIDVYSICFMANDIVHRLLFLFYCLGVFIMTLNIAVAVHETTSEGRRLEAEVSESTPGDLNYIGSCSFETNYLYGFAAGFVFTRLSLAFLYFLSASFSHNRDHIREYCIKMTPNVLSAIVMFFIFGNHSPLVVIPMSALVGFLADVLPEPLTEVKFRPESEALQERLGLFFMLVLGESMIGLLTVEYNLEKPAHSYGVLIFSFCLVFSIGMQFFDTVHRSTEVDHSTEEEEKLRIEDYINEKLDSRIYGILAEEGVCDEAKRQDRRQELKRSSELTEDLDKEYKELVEEMEEKLAAQPYEHALDSKNPFIRMPFIWFHCTISFFMLIATNGFVNLYYAVIDTAEHSLYGLQFKVSLGLCIVVGLMAIMRGLHRKAGFHVYLMKDYKRVLFKLTVATMHLIVFALNASPAYCIVIHSFIAGFNNFIEVVWHFINITLLGETEAQLADEAGGTTSGETELPVLGHHTSGLIQPSIDFTEGNNIIVTKDAIHVHSGLGHEKVYSREHYTKATLVQEQIRTTQDKTHQTFATSELGL